MTGLQLDWKLSDQQKASWTVIVDGKESNFKESKKWSTTAQQGIVFGPVFFIVYAIDIILRVKS